MNIQPLDDYATCSSSLSIHSDGVTKKEEQKIVIVEPQIDDDDLSSDLASTDDNNDSSAERNQSITAQKDMTKKKGGGIFAKVSFLILYILQLGGSIIFLRWLIRGAWNEYNPFASGFFFVAEIVAFISSTLFLSSALFIWIPIKGKQQQHQQQRPTTTRPLQSGNETDPETSGSDTGSSSGSSSAAAGDEETPACVADDERPTVAVCVCRYKEPLEDLLQTVQSLDEILWPSANLQLYILDDGWSSITQEQQKLQLDGLYGTLNCTQEESSAVGFQTTSSISRPDCATKCTYLKIRDESFIANKASVTLIAREKPQESHYKAGNLNNFLYNYLSHHAESSSSPCPDYVLILDHDMLPHPEIVVDAVKRHQQDEKLAFIQYPQRFYDLVGSDVMYAGNEIFFDGVQVNRGHVGLAAFAGTNAVWRLQALYHVGGLQYGSLTEDASTGLAAHSIGYSSGYSQSEMAVGQSPQTVEDAMQQRMRWSQGAIEILIKYTGAYCTGKSPVDDIPLPPNLARRFDLDRPEPPSIFRKFLMFIIYFDSMIYPFYSAGYILHVVVCVLYLITAEAPMSPSHPIMTLLYWLPLYAIKFLCQLSAFPMVSLSTQWNASMAWAGYSISTLVSVMKAFRSKLGRGGGGWFNTGGGSNDRFLLQYGNTVMAVTLYAMMVYRLFAFIFMDDEINPWMTIGALLYGAIMLFHVQAWAIEPFRNHEKREMAQSVRNKAKSSQEFKESLHSLALTESQKHRDVHHSFSLSTIIMFVNVVLFSFVLFYWGTYNVPTINASPTQAPGIITNPTLSPTTKGNPSGNVTLLTTTNATNAWEVFQGLKNLTKTNSVDPPSYSLVSTGGVAGNGGSTVSEGQGYALLITGIVLASWEEHAGKEADAVRDDVLSAFEGYYNFWKKMCQNSVIGTCQDDGKWNHCFDSVANKSSVCLPDWKQNSNGSISEENGNAPDGDEDAIVGIILAVSAVTNDTTKPVWYDDARKWADASSTAFFKFNVEDTFNGQPTEQRLLKLGACWGGWEGDGNNPSYHSPGSYKVMRDYQQSFPNAERNGAYSAIPTDEWNRLVSTSYEAITAIQCRGDGALFPNWATFTLDSNGRVQNYGAEFAGSDTAQNRYGSEATRTTWRVALDAVLYPQEAYGWSEILNSFIIRLRAGYDEDQYKSFDGNTFPSCLPEVNPGNFSYYMFDDWRDQENMFMYASTMSALVVGEAEDSEMIDAVGSFLNEDLPTDYYPRSWVLLSNLMLSGAIESAGKLL